jgi:endogenous inhibitor of DNA gyrase (YacG/DUF329 family)
MARCPVCKKNAQNAPENGSFPFCGPRCKLVDLGSWLDGRYVIADKALGYDLDAAEGSQNSQVTPENDE